MKYVVFADCSIVKYMDGDEEIGEATVFETFLEAKKHALTCINNAYIRQLDELKHLKRGEIE